MKSIYWRSFAEVRVAHAHMIGIELRLNWNSGHEIH